VHPVIFTPAARAELIGAQDWYENEVPGLGKRFRAAIDAAIERMSDNPRQFPVVYRSIRRALLRRFPCAPVCHRGRRESDRHRVFSRQPRSGALAKAGMIHKRPFLYWSE